MKLSILDGDMANFKLLCNCIIFNNKKIPTVNFLSRMLGLNPGPLLALTGNIIGKRDES